MNKDQTMLISGETARYELTHLNLYCLQIFNLALKELKELEAISTIYAVDTMSLRLCMLI